MKLTIKNFKQQIFIIEIDEDLTVLDLKKKFQEISNNEYLVESQTLIYAGIILDDLKKLSEYKIDEKKFIVAMNRKPKTADAAAATTPAAKEENEKNVKIHSESIVKEAERSRGNTDKNDEKKETSANNEKTFVSESVTNPTEVQNAIKRICEMGFSEQQAKRALRKSYNNPDRAVEYLLSGDLNTPEEQQIIDFSSSSRGTTNTTSGNNASNPLAFLRNDPKFLQIRRTIQQDPSLINIVISEISRTNPSLLALLKENMEEFVNILSERDANDPPDVDNSFLDQIFYVVSESLRNSRTPERTDDNRVINRNLSETEASSDEGGGGPTVIRVTAEERAAIERLKELGFPEELVIQVYFACDKDEQQAANLLFQQNNF